MKILAIDPATKLGWSVNNVLYGMEDFNLRKGESEGFKFIRFKAFLQKLIDTEKPAFVVYERAAGRFKNDIMSHAKFIVMIETVCIEKGVEYRAYSPSEIKRHATGNGAAKKLQMLQAAVRKFRKPIKDDNIADAMHLCDLAQNDLQ